MSNIELGALLQLQMYQKTETLLLECRELLKGLKSQSIEQFVKQKYEPTDLITPRVLADAKEVLTGHTANKLSDKKVDVKYPKVCIMEQNVDEEDLDDGHASFFTIDAEDPMNGWDNLHLEQIRDAVRNAEDADDETVSFGTLKDLEKSRKFWINKFVELKKDYDTFYTLVTGKNPPTDDEDE